MKRRPPSPADLWLRKHPNDIPCPSAPAAATAWRQARGISDLRAIEWLSRRNGGNVQIKKQIADINQRRRR